MHKIYLTELKISIIYNFIPVRKLWNQERLVVDLVKRIYPFYYVYIYENNIRDQLSVSSYKLLEREKHKKI